MHSSVRAHEYVGTHLSTACPRDVTHVHICATFVWHVWRKYVCMHSLQGAALALRFARRSRSVDATLAESATLALRDPTSEAVVDQASTLPLEARARAGGVGGTGGTVGAGRADDAGTAGAAIAVGAAPGATEGASTAVARCGGDVSCVGEMPLAWLASISSM